MDKLDKFQVKIMPNADGEIPSDAELLAYAEEAGWSDDPGTGKAIMLPDARGNPAYEVLNPIPFAPPIGFEPTPPIDELIRQRVRDAYRELKDEDEIDDIIDAEDFDIPDELPELNTIYEFIGMEEEVPPAVPSKISDEERIKAELDFEDLKDRERRLRRHRAKVEYDRRRAEEEALYGPSEAVRGALLRRGEEEGGQ